MRSLALVAAVGAPIAFGVGSVLQKSAADSVDRANGLGLALLGRLGRQWRYVAGNLADLAGWLLQVLALTTLPVFVVQGFMITSAAFTAVFAAAVLHTPLPRSGWGAVATVVAGGVAIAAVAPTDAPVRIGPAGWAACASALVVLAAAGGWTARNEPFNDGAFLGVIAGLAFSVVAVLSKAVAPIPGGPALHRQIAALLITPTPYLLLTAGAVAVLLYATGLHRSHVTAVEAPLVITELIVPIAVGVLVLGEPVPHGVRAAVMTVGLAAALGGVIALVRVQRPGDGTGGPRRARGTGSARTATTNGQPRRRARRARPRD